MAQNIILNNGRIAIVDDEYYETLKSYRWSFHAKRYAIRTTCRTQDSGDVALMHHHIVGKPKRGFVVDHINGNGLDNRACNLRVVSHGENLRNQKKPSKNNKLGEKLISIDNWKNRHKYKVSWHEMGDCKQKHKKFSTLEDAIKFRNEILQKHYKF